MRYFISVTGQSVDNIEITEAESKLDVILWRDFSILHEWPHGNEDKEHICSWDRRNENFGCEFDFEVGTVGVCVVEVEAEVMDGK